MSPLDAPRDGTAGDETALLRRAKGGDGQAFGVLVERYQHVVYRLALRVVGPDAADDVAQQAFLQAWLRLEQFRGDAAFGTWLFRIAMNCCLDLARKADHGRVVPLARSVDAAAPTEDVAEQVVSAIERTGRQDALAWALQQLSADERLLLHLRLGEGLKYNAIAHLLEVAPATVGTRLFRARARLHALVTAYLGEETHAMR